MGDTTAFLVWWTHQDDTEILRSPPYWSRHPKVPAYVRRQFSQRYGRSGRGRLWVAPGIDVDAVAWDDKWPTCRAAARCGGIVFHRADLAAVAALPGFITDLDMNEVRQAPPPPPPSEVASD